MWVLTEVIRARQAAARIGRFDVSPSTLLTAIPPCHMAQEPSQRGCSQQDGAGVCQQCCAGCDSRSLLQVDGCYDVNMLSYT